MKVLFLDIPETRHQGPHQGPPRAEQEDRGAPPSAVRHLRPLRPPQPAGDPPEGSHVQEQAQA